MAYSPVFHVSLLKQWRPSTVQQVPGEVELEEADQHQYFDVEKILRWRWSSKTRRRRREFLVLWQGVCAPAKRGRIPGHTSGGPRRMTRLPQMKLQNYHSECLNVQHHVVCHPCTARDAQDAGHLFRSTKWDTHHNSSCQSGRRYIMNHLPVVIVIL